MRYGHSRNVVSFPTHPLQLQSQQGNDYKILPDRIHITTAVSAAVAVGAEEAAVAVAAVAAAEAVEAAAEGTAVAAAAARSAN